MRCGEVPQIGLTYGFSAGTAGQRFYGTFTRTKNERQTRRLGWDSLLSRSDRCKRTSGAAAAADGGHFSQHSVKLPPQGQVSGEIGPRAPGNGGFPGFKVRIRRGRGGQTQLTGLATPHPRIVRVPAVCKFGLSRRHVRWGGVEVPGSRSSRSE